MNQLPGYDSWKLEEPPYLRDESEVVDRCCVCGCAIHEGEDYYDVYDDIVCHDCGLDYIRTFRKTGVL